MPQISGAKHFRAKLSTEQVDKLRDLRENQPHIYSYGALRNYASEHFGVEVGESTIRDIVTYVTRLKG